jgi:ribulose-phosphate 3-epimerase
MKQLPMIAPSILSADFGRLADEIREVENGGADAIHMDVMDGRFVPNITIGPGVVASLRRVSRLPLDVHLMIVEPEDFVQAFVDAGADTITFHVESTPHVQRVLAKIRGLGKRCGVALCPHTPVNCLQYILDDLDMVIVMSVNPGFGGQSFLPATLEKIRAIRELIDSSGNSVHLSVDGGITRETVARASRAGADYFVAGASVYGCSNRQLAIQSLREAAEQA